MDSREPRTIPEPTLRRLPLYHQYLSEINGEGLRFASCSQIGKALNLDSSQIRKDLAVAEVSGKPNVGYLVPDLLRAIESLLGWDNAQDAFLVGAGNLGSALLGYEKFRQYGLNILAAFDIDPERIGRQIHGKQVLSLAKLPNLAARMHIHLGIIAVPAAAAQSVAHLMVEGGIRAIWNFAPATLKVPQNVIVQTENLYSSLAALSYKLAQQLGTEIGAAGPAVSENTGGIDSVES
jgi:redox-sensing transcriptional repressor